MLHGRESCRRASPIAERFAQDGRRSQDLGRVERECASAIGASRQGIMRRLGLDLDPPIPRKDCVSTVAAGP